MTNDWHDAGKAVFVITRQQIARQADQHIFMDCLFFLRL